MGILLFLFSSCIQNPVSGKKVRLINEAGEKIKVLEINPRTEVELPFEIDKDGEVTIEHAECEGMSFIAQIGDKKYSGSTGYIQDTKSYRIRFYMDDGYCYEVSYKSLGQDSIFKQKLTEKNL